MASVYLFDSEEGIEYVAPELSDEETLEYLVKVSSGTLVETKIEDAEFDHIEDSYCVFSKQSLPSDIKSLINLDHRMNNPRFMGRVCHLASHIRHTRFHEHIAVQDSPKKDLMWWLEDLRSEKNYLEERQLDTHNLREHWLSKVKSLEDEVGLSALDMSLMYVATVGRSLSGAFLKTESDNLRKRFIGKIPNSTMDQFDELLSRYIQIEDESDGVEASLIAQEWLKLTDHNISPAFALNCMDGSPVLHVVGNIGEGSTENSDQPGMESDVPSDTGDSEESSDSSQQGDSKENEEESDKKEDSNSDASSSEDKEASEEKSDSEDTSNDTSNSDNKPQSESELDKLSDAIDSDELPDDIPEVFEPPPFDEKKYQQKQAEDRARNNATQAADRVFPKIALRYKTRPPTQEDNNLASSLAITFRKARWRAPTKTHRTSKTPPGRLSSRTAVAMTAQRSMGIPVTAEPFRQTVRKRVEGPPPIVGMACDLSGSMKASTAPMAQIMWACSRAVPRAGGKFAAVSFGHEVKSLIAPGAKPMQVPVLSATQREHKAFEAVSALTGGLNLLGNIEGVKILIISSDAIWGNHEASRTLKLLKQLEKHGVHIFWIPFQQDVFMPKQRRNKNTLGILIPLLEIGSVLEFQKPSEVPKELAKLITKKIEQG